MRLQGRRVHWAWGVTMALLLVVPAAKAYSIEPSALLEPSVSASDVDAIIELLAMSDEQAASARRLDEAYAAAYAEKTAPLRAAATEGEAYGALVRAGKPADEAKLEAIQRRYDEARVALRKSRVSLRRQLLNDLRSLLTAQQDARWPMVERRWRRGMLRSSRFAERTVAHWSGWELVTVIDRLRLSDADAAAIRPTLDAYELELDTLLKQLQLAWDEDDLRPDLSTPETAAALTRRELELGAAMGALNRRYARLLGAGLPLEAATRLNEVVRVTAYSILTAYRKGFGLAWLDHVEAFEDLDEGQRARLAAIREAYAAESDRLLFACERMIDRRDAELAAMPTEQIDAAIIGRRPLPGAFDTPSAFGAMSEAEGTTVAKVRAVLTAEQSRRVPKEDWGRWK